MKADRLLIAPQDLRTADADPGERDLCRPLRLRRQGRDLRRPLAVRDRCRRPTNGRWQLLGFGWLRHLRAAEFGITRANARALVDDWISQRGAWTLDRLAAGRGGAAHHVVADARRRWCCNDADVRFYRRFLRSLTRQVRYLRHTAKRGARRRAAPAGDDRARATRRSCMPARRAMLKTATRQLVRRARARRSCPTAATSAAIPSALIELLLDLLPLRAGLRGPQHPPPPALHQRHRPHDADAALLPARRRQLRACSTAWGRPRSDLLATVLAYDDARGAPVVERAALRLSARARPADAVLIVDTGPPPPIEVSQEAHAGCLSFELSARPAPDRGELRHARPTSRETWAARWRAPPRRIRP